jgi:hypothetical protein
MNFYLKSGNPCQLYLKNQGEPSQALPPAPPIIENVPKPSNYMARVKENFSRAWQRWDESEDLQLRENFDARKDLNLIRVWGKQFRFIYPLSKQSRKYLKNSTVEWNIDYPKDKDLIWDILRPGETDKEQTTIMPFIQTGYIELQNISN